MITVEDEQQDLNRIDQKVFASMTTAKVKDECREGLETLEWIEIKAKKANSGNQNLADLSLGQLHLRWEPDLSLIESGEARLAIINSLG